MNIDPQVAAYFANERPMPACKADTMLRYANDAGFRGEIDAETEANRARANAAIDAGMRKYWEGRS